MSLKLSQFTQLGSEKTLNSEKHILFVLSEQNTNDFPYSEIVHAKLKRANGEFKDLNKTPMTLDLPNGGMASFVILANQLSTFQRHALLCKATEAFREEQPSNISICIFGDEATDEDYESDLDSKIADIKQCSLSDNPDHIHAARFLGRFVEGDVAWLHTDLSSANREGGLGAVASNTTGFGVGFGLEMIQCLIK